MASVANSTYTQGHHPSVTGIHAARTAENSAQFLLPHLRPDMHILDIGCGPGSITCTLAKYVPEGSVIGVDISEAVLKQANRIAEDIKNVSFEIGNITDGLTFPNGIFDVVFCHQTLLHITNHGAALKEMKRLCRSGGIVACREGDIDSLIHYPMNEGLKLYWETYRTMFHEGGQTTQAGRSLHTWGREAGFDPDKMIKNAGVTLCATKGERQWYGTLHKERIAKSDLRDRFKAVGLSDADLDKIIAGLDEWINNDDGWNAIIQGELICRCA